MATVFHGVLRGESGFSRTVAIKRLHPHYAKDAELSNMLRDEARVTARIRHPHVVPMLDVVASSDELFLVMEYVHGESLANLVRAAQRGDGAVPRDVVSAIICGALHGLHAAHDATDEGGVLLHIVHRDVSPQNILVGADGVARVLDFGIAKAVGRSQTTRNGELKGKLAYMAPEQLMRESLDRRTDVYGMGVVLWELLTLQRLFHGDSEGLVMALVLGNQIDPPSTLAEDVPAALDELVARAVSRDRSKRFATAREMALALEATVPVASATRVAAWVEELAGEALTRRARGVAQAESDARSGSMEALEEVSPESPSERDPGARPLPLERARRGWIGYAFVLVAGAAIAFAAARRVESPAAVLTPPSPAASAADVGVPTSLPAPPAPLPASLPVAAPTTPPSPPVHPPSRSTGKATARPAAAAASGRKGCDWHTEDGIWVPTNCR